MKRNLFDRKCFFIILFSLVFLSWFFFVSHSQLTLQSFTPADGTTNVDPAVTFEFIFNAAIDTSALYEMEDEGYFYLGLLFYPDTLVGDPDSITVSPDLKTIWVHNLHLQADTRYVFGILGARSIAGDSLDIPTVVTFSTGASLPTATVSGTISYPSGDPTGTLVALFEGSIGNETPAAFAVVPTATGVFTIDHVPGGTYWPIAMKDLNRSGDFEPEPGIDVLGVYDPSSTGFGDSLVVQDDATITTVDITLTPMSFLTARDRYADVLAAAQVWNSDVFPVMIAAPEIDSVGTSGFWIYMFYSASASDYFGLLASNVFISPFSDMEMMPDTNIALPDLWLDSDVVTDSAETNGGSTFRQTNSDAEASAFLTYMDPEGGFPGFNKTGFLPTPQIFPSENRKLNNSSTTLLKTNNSLEIQAIWGFSYYSEQNNDFMPIFLDALTGEFVGPIQPEPLTARFNLAAADLAAQNWAADRELITVGVASHMGDVNPDGKAMMWYYIYYSAVLGTEQMFFMSNGQFMGQDTLDWDPPSRNTLPANWVDSDMIMSIAEANGGSQYRAANQDVWVGGLLSRGMFYYGDPNLPVWKIDYGSGPSPQETLTIFIDAVTKEVLGAPSSIPTTAQYNIGAADGSAQGWAFDAQLLGVGVWGEDMTPTGEAVTWMFWYTSATQDSGWMVMVSDGIVINEEQPDNWNLPNYTSLPVNWIDSDSAANVSEANGGALFRSNNQTVSFGVGLMRGLLPGEPDRAVWDFSYKSDVDSMDIFVDAVTGEFITLISAVNPESEFSGLPESYALVQNFPNPFNPETEIKYQLPQNSNVEISIFNLKGQKVVTLLMGNKTAGFHNIRWNGLNKFGQSVASGVYLYKLTADNFTAVKKMLLVR